MPRTASTTIEEGKVFNRKEQAKRWADPELFATTLIALFIDAYGTEALGWSPATIIAEIEDDFGVTLPLVNVDKLMAAIHVVTQDDFFQDVAAFIDLCSALNNDSVSINDVKLPDALDCAWGITEAMLLSPPENDEPFSDEIRRYVGVVLQDEGIMSPPDVLKVAFHDGQIVKKVSAAFSEDPIMFAAIAAVEKDKTDDVNATVKARLRTLFDQLENLPLRHGNVKRLVSRVAKVLPR